MRSTFFVSEMESKFDFNNVIKVTFSFIQVKSEQLKRPNAQIAGPLLDSWKKFRLIIYSNSWMKLNWEIKNNTQISCIFSSVMIGTTADYWLMESASVEFCMNIRILCRWFISFKRFMRIVPAMLNMFSGRLLPSDSLPPGA